MGDAEASATGGTRVIALFGGAGAPGRTTLGVNLLAVLGASRRAVLVDLDLTGSAVAAHLRAVHPAWNIVDLALAHPRTADGWDQILEGRLQPIGSFSQGARVLCGVARPQQRANITPAFVEGLVGQLRERFDHVLLTWATSHCPIPAVRRWLPRRRSAPPTTSCSSRRQIR